MEQQLRLGGDCHWRTSFDHALGDRIASEAGDVMDVQLIHDLLPVLLDGFDADREFGGDLLVRKSLCD